MKIFIAEFDLFESVGGGQTFYRNLIINNPHLQFYYLINQEKLECDRTIKLYERSKNVKIFPYKQRYIKSDLNRINLDLPVERISRPFLFASNIAYSIKNHNFDIIDLPDYQQYGLFLGSALNKFNVKYNKLVLSLHGVVSQSLKQDWVIDESYIKNLEFAENIQYKIADIRYGISKQYLEYWQEKNQLKSYYFHPLKFLNIPFTDKQNPEQKLSKSKDDLLPSLNFIGRKEKGKGVDIFVNLLELLPKNLYHQGNIIGGNPNTIDGKTGEFYLQQMLNYRQSKINIYPSFSSTQLHQQFTGKTITILPSRFDTLNLVALESLFTGCPTLISNKAGVSRFLKDNFPHLPFITIDIDNYYDSIPSILELLNNYQPYQVNLKNQLKKINIDVNSLGMNIDDIYQKESHYDSYWRNKVDDWYDKLIDYCENKQYWQKEKLVSFTKALTTSLSLPLDKNIQEIKSIVNQQKKTIHSQIIKAIFFPKEFKRIINLPEISDKEIENKISKLKNLSHPTNSDSISGLNYFKTGYFIHRLKIWQEISRLEKLRGNNLLSACYEIRIIRLLNQDKFKQLNYITNTLNNHNLPSLAEVVNLLYKPQGNQSHLCYQYLLNQYQNLLNYQEKPYQYIKDYRSKKNYRVSVIVSLYNAESKLGHFLSILTQQTLWQKNQLEIILVDSASPQNEYQVFQQFFSLDKTQNNSPQDIPVVYGRSEERETIQSAWNRGIVLSQSPYITFLGVDEVVTSGSLEILADELDRKNDLDWVVGNSIVTEVDEKGKWLTDVMTYNRTNFSQHFTYLDTCYLTYVGGLYRRSIHQRFGFYDESFKGAGDTEFKNRILPHIKCGFVRDVWGIFLNYPEVRTTQNFFTELEDLRAWYIYRSIGGVNYGFQGKDVSNVEQLLFSCLYHQKSFLKGGSTDFSLAFSLINWLKENHGDSYFLLFAEGIRKILTIYQQIEYPPNLFFSKINLPYLYLMNNYINQEHFYLVRGLNINNTMAVKNNYQIFNDNRYEQHFYPW